MNRDGPCPRKPASPLLCRPLGAGAGPQGAVLDELGDDVPIQEEHAIWGESIIGHEGVLLDDKGPWAIPALSLPTPQGITPKQWAQHC